MGNHLESGHWLFMLSPCSQLKDICPHLLWFLRLNKLDGWMSMSKVKNGHVENKDEVELKSSCELFVPSPRILLSEFKPYRSACLTFFPLDLHRLCLCVECEGFKRSFCQHQRSYSTHCTLIRAYLVIFPNGFAVPTIFQEDKCRWADRRWEDPTPVRFTQGLAREPYE